MVIYGIKGGHKYERDYAQSTVDWCVPRLGLKQRGSFKVYIVITSLEHDSGYCEELGNGSYMITVAQNQSLRDFIMTLVHEMIHIKQYVLNEWTGDGEDEAWGLQEQLTDELWESDIL